MRCQGQTIEAVCVEQRYSVQKRDIRAAELERLSVRTGMSLLVHSVVRDSGLAVDAGNLPLGASRTNGRPSVAASFGLNAVVAVLLPRSQHTSGYYRARHFVVPGLCSDDHGTSRCVKHGMVAMRELGERCCQLRIGGSATPLRNMGLRSDAKSAKSTSQTRASRSRRIERCQCTVIT